MKKIITLLTFVILVGCSTTQSNLKIDSIDTFNLNNYNEFNIKINSTNMSAEVNPIALEKFKENLKTGLAATTSIISMIISYFYLIFSSKTFLIIVFLQRLHIIFLKVLDFLYHFPKEIYI